MLEAAPVSSFVRPAADVADRPRHSAVVRITHWLTALCFGALLLSGVEILISHPRFYWGEAGNVLTTPLFVLPIPASRSSVPTGYGFVLPDQNGWSRALHFQSAWVVVFTGLVYTIASVFSGHFRKNLVPATADLSRRAIASVVVNHWRRQSPESGAQSYNVLQRIAYLLVIAVLFPLEIWTGLAMSPAFVSAFPFAVTALGGQQSARTIHFFAAVALVLFFGIHVEMVRRAGFFSRIRAMTTGETPVDAERM
jgi:thiosulfate reductase cytochrome b subunit